MSRRGAPYPRPALDERAATAVVGLPDPAAERRAVNRASELASRLLGRGGALVPSRLVRAYDAMLIRHRIRRGLGYRPDLRNPRTFNEKIGWRILNDRNPLLALTTDKIGVREYVADKVGPDILVPLIGVYDRVADIPWDALPNRFVLKASHGCAMNLLVHDKSAVDRDAIIRTAAKWLTQNYYDSSRQWAYRRIPPRLLVEELLIDDEGRIPDDFKFYVFDGRTALLRVHIDRFGEHRVNYYDSELHLLDVTQVVGPDPGYRLAPEVPGMMRVAERLAEDFDHARIDLYLVGGRVRFGEITHYDGAGQVPFVPRAYDVVLGDNWRLPTGADATAPGSTAPSRRRRART
jgi:hypothetical protein